MMAAADGAQYGIDLTERDLAFLNGDAGAGGAMAMRVLLSLGRARRATRLIDIEAAHVDACIYVGDVSLDFARRLADGGAKVSVPATLNVGGIDLLHPGLWKGDPEEAARSRQLMDVYQSLGCSPTWTCAPYQLPNRPAFGAQVAWGESNAIVFANSVLGARTERYGDFVDISAAIVGRVPYAGLHRDEARRARVVIDVSSLGEAWAGRDELFPLLGFAIGRLTDDAIPAIAGIEAASEDQLKALGAAAASSGAVAMFHVAGVTPEAPTIEDALGGGPPEHVHQITEDDLRAAWQALCTRRDGALGAVCIGTPHYSVAEFEHLAALLGNRHVHHSTPLYVNTSRSVLERIDVRGIGARLRASGVSIVTDTCTYTAPILGQVQGLVMTNSAKWAWYAPRNINVDVVFASLESCIESAVRGEVHDASLF